MSDMRVKLVLDMLDRVSAPSRQMAQRFNASMDAMGERTRVVGNRMKDLGKSASISITAPLALLTRQSISAQKQFEAVQAKMFAVFRDAAMVDVQMKRLRAESERMGTVFFDMADGYAGFTAAVRGGGFALEQSNEMFKNFTETAVSLNSSPEKIGYIFKALEQMAGKPTIMMEELKVQLSDHIPGAIGIAARAMNMPIDKFIKAVERGRIKTGVFLPKFAEQMKKELGGGFDAASQGLQAFENRQTNALKEAELQANKSGLQDFYMRLRQIIGDLARGFMELSPGMQKFAVYAGIGAMVFGPLLLGIGQLAIGIGFLIPAIGALAPLLASMASGFAAFGVALLTTPVGWFVLAIAAITLGSVLLIKNWSKVSAFFTSMWEGIKTSFKNGVDWVTKLIQPLLAVMDRIKNSPIARRLGFGGGAAMATGQTARASGPEVPFGGMGGVSGLDAGGTIKIQIDGSGQPQVKEVKANDKRMSFKTETGLLMGAH